MNDDQPANPSARDGAADGSDARRRLATLRVEHEDLDASVAALAGLTLPDQVRIARLKKKKLLLRDEIARLEDQLTPDIIA